MTIVRPPRGVRWAQPGARRRRRLWRLTSGLAARLLAEARRLVPRKARSEQPRVRRQMKDPYEILGVARSANGEELRAVWRNLMRENHPDALAARGVPKEFIDKASQSVARINAAWDRIKRERGL